MAITLRGYDVDETGKRYTLDPELLLREQGRAFATQRETMQMVADVGRKGIEFAEYLGARQQLGRVKAQLSELDPRDPDFTRRYTAIVMDNPLAFTNANTAPVAKMATDVTLKTAVQAQEQRDVLERISLNTVQDERVLGLRTAADERLLRLQASLPKQFAPRAPRVPSVAERLLFGGDITDTPAAPAVMPPGSVAPPGELMPEGLIDPSAPSPLPFMEDDELFETPVTPEEATSQDGEVFDRVIQSDAELIEGEGDTTTDPKNIVNTPYGRMRLKGVTGNSVALESIETASASKPTTAPPKGTEWVVKESNPDGTPAKWGLLKIPERSAEQRATLEKTIEKRVAVDPRVKAVDEAIADAKGAYDSAKLAYEQMFKGNTDADPQLTASLQSNMRTLAQTLVKLEQQKQALTFKAVDEYMTQLDPIYAEYVQRLRVPTPVAPNIVSPSAATSAPSSESISRQLDDALQAIQKR
jgi:hypothetical protein